MKICIVSQTFRPQDEGGAEISSHHAALNLSQNHDVCVLALGLEGDIDIPTGFQTTDDPYRIFRVPYKNSYLPGPKRPAVSTPKKAMWHLKNALGAVAAKDLERFFDAEKFDLIYAQNSSRMQPALYDVAAKMDIPVCQHLRDYALLCPKASMYKKGENCAKQCGTCKILTARMRHASQSVTSVIAVSDFVRQRFLKHGLFKDANFHVLHNTNTARKNFNADLLSKRPDPEPEFTFGYLGALSVEKGVEVIIRAFCALPADIPAKLLIAGRGHSDFVNEMKALSDKLAKGRVEWLGHVPPETVFSRSEVAIMSSLWEEPQGRVLVEAATYCIPVFAAKSGGIPEFVEKYHTGWTYPPKDINALTALMTKSAQNGADAWRTQLGDHFKGLADFDGTAEGTDFYNRLDAILTAAVVK